MRVCVQRVLSARVESGGERLGEIGRGFLLLVGVATGDTEADVEWMAGKVSRLRIFPDPAGKMDRTLSDVGGAILSVSQFTLCADMKKGNRPSFGEAAKPADAERLWMAFNQKLRDSGMCVETGRFGADMEVSLINDGPVTLWLDSRV